jgi:ferredoxin
VFEIRDDGFLYILQEEPNEALRAQVTLAEELCPTGAITVTD